MAKVQRECNFILALNIFNVGWNMNANRIALDLIITAIPIFIMWGRQSFVPKRNTLMPENEATSAWVKPFLIQKELNRSHTQTAAL